MKRYLVIGQYWRDGHCVLNEFDFKTQATKYMKDIKKRLSKNWRVRILDRQFGEF